ncbi:MAG: class I SAM-dependent methyltransferase [Lentisphaerae bacterium]|nr:class I SAM-dependent methyltransferase [Lentisphaerota bacterium]
MVGSILSPTYWLLAHRNRVPGLQVRLHCAFLGLSLLYSHKAPVSYVTVYHLLFWPMDSTRYFEFDFMWRVLISIDTVERYLDVSSPRLFPILVSSKKRKLKADLINPDTKDLAITANLIRAIGLTDRCRWHNCLIETAPFETESFDMITSISVMEHIPQDTPAIKRMWDLLRRGGRLLLSVPCAAEASEQYINRNEYGLLEPDEKGFVFGQRFYDLPLLQERIFSVTGPPNRYAIYGEKIAGSFLQNAERKRTDPQYPYWREPYMMGEEYRYFEGVSDLPGEGVIAMEFIKR